MQDTGSSSSSEEAPDLASPGSEDNDDDVSQPLLGSFGAQRRCDAGGPDADEPPVVSAAKDTA